MSQAVTTCPCAQSNTCSRVGCHVTDVTASSASKHPRSAARRWVTGEDEAPARRSSTHAAASSPPSARDARAPCGESAQQRMLPVPSGAASVLTFSMGERLSEVARGKLLERDKKRGNKLFGSPQRPRHNHRRAPLSFVATFPPHRPRPRVGDFARRDERRDGPEVLVVSRPRRQRRTPPRKRRQRQPPPKQPSRRVPRAASTRRRRGPRLGAPAALVGARHRRLLGLRRLAHPRPRGSVRTHTRRIVPYPHFSHPPRKKNQTSTHTHTQHSPASCMCIGP